MTSIVSLLAGPFVQQASDRLVTVRRGRAIQAHDAHANKAIVLVAEDAVAAIGYTGLAFAGDEPMDAFLASHFAGRELGSVGTLTVGGPPTQRIGKSIVGLLRRLEQLPIDPGLERDAPTILITGWRWRDWPNGRRTDRGTFRWTIHRHPDRTYAFDRMFRPAIGSVNVSGVPKGRLVKPEVDAYLDELARDPTHSKELAEDLLASLIRTVADRSRSASDPTVGSDVMVITIPPPHKDREIRVRYVPAPGSTSTSSFGSFAPWIVGPGRILKPSEISPGFRFDVGPFTIQTVGPGPDAGHFGFRAMDRAKPPG